jgi:hypothetical protein
MIIFKYVCIFIILQFPYLSSVTVSDNSIETYGFYLKEIKENRLTDMRLRTNDMP